MLHQIVHSVHKHSEELGGGATGLVVYLFKYFMLGERIWNDLHDLVMAALSAVVGYFAVIFIRWLFQKDKTKISDLDNELL